VRVVYRLAAGLAQRRHSVSIIHPLIWLGAPSRRRHPVLELLSWCKHRLLADYRPVRWLPLEPQVGLRLVPRISARWIGEADVLVATSWRTMAAVVALPPRCGSGMALLQHFEEWDGGREQVVEAWRLPLRKLAVSRWLCRTAEQLGVRCDYIGNAVDHDLFFTEKPPEQRTDPLAALMGHSLSWKGTKVALQALTIARQEIPKLSAEMFAVELPNLELPEWVHPTIEPMPDQLRGIYNRAQVFLAPSLSEGWDLPATEAMACGAALIASDIPVREEYAVHGESALLVPAGNAAEMARAIVRLLRNPSLRLQLARKGTESAQQLTWEKCVQRFEQALTETHRHPRQ